MKQEAVATIAAAAKQEPRPDKSSFQGLKKHIGLFSDILQLDSNVTNN